MFVIQYLLNRDIVVANIFRLLINLLIPGGIYGH